MLRILLLLSALIFSSTLMATIQVEAEFLEKMNAHHSDAIKLSQMALQKSQNTKIKKLAETIVKNQSKEQKEMKKLQSQNYNDVKVPQGEIPAMVDIQKLENVSGTDFDREYLEAMTKHHKSGIEMMGKMMPNIDKRAIHRLAIKMVKKQGNEIAKMEKIQKTIE